MKALALMAASPVPVHVIASIGKLTGTPTGTAKANLKQRLRYTSVPLAKEAHRHKNVTPIKSSNVLTQLLWSLSPSRSALPCPSPGRSPAKTPASIRAARPPATLLVEVCFEHPLPL